MSEPPTPRTLQANVPQIRPLAGQAEALFCANIIVNSEPWITLGRGLDHAMRAVTDATREVYVAEINQEVAGFAVLNFNGPFVGYLHTLAVAEPMRNRGIGTALIKFSEQRTFREHPNLFLCVSSFNHGARKLYERLGYEFIGELKDYVVRGHSEFLLRKKIAPLDSFQRPNLQVAPTKIGQR